MVLPLLLVLAAPSTPQTSISPKPSSKIRPVSHSTVAKKKAPDVVYKRLNALRVAKRTAFVKHAAVRPLAVISPAVRASSLAFVSQRLQTFSSHFEQSDALQPFFERLTRSLQNNSAIHVLQYGDSHTASDDWVDAMRVAFQDKYGFGGPVFTMPGHPFRGYRRFDVRGDNSAGWVTSGTVGHLSDGRNGLAGISVTASRPGETITLVTSGDILELFYLRQPGGGSFALERDGIQIDTVSTDGEQSTGFYSATAIAGEHTYRLRTLSWQPVRLFGWVSENRHGLTWETLGINGAQCNMILQWDQRLWKEQIARRDPALVIIAYGTNEALYPLWTAQQYEADLQATIQRFRSAVPDAAILLVGPPACGRTRPFPHLQQVIQIQRTVARSMGVAFWDWQSSMLESGGRFRWVQAGLSQPDYTHLTGDGYRMLGGTLAQQISAEYSQYLAQHRVTE
jgi:lysophospholipase L1-like esterase